MNKMLKVSRINGGSQADKQDVLVGDYIVSYNGQNLSSNEDLSTAMSSATEEGKPSVIVLFNRDGQKRILEFNTGALGITCEVSNYSPTLTANPNGSEASTAIASLITFIGWCTVILSLMLLAFITWQLFGQNPYSTHQMPDRTIEVTILIAAFINGLILIAAGQVTRATLNTANYSKQMLEMMRLQNK